MKFILGITLLFFQFCTVHGQEIQHESAQSLYVEVYHDNILIGKATAFIIRPKEKYYLVTNYHVLSGKFADKDEWLPNSPNLAPNRIKIYHNGIKLGIHVAVWEPLINDEQNLWKEFKHGIGYADVAVLPLTDVNGVELHPVDYTSIAETLVRLGPTDRLFVIGFPNGMSGANNFPIWKSGIIASEPSLQQEQKPVIWLDMMGIGGMSGSPVYFIENNFIESNGNRAQTVEPVHLFAGIFSHGHPSIELAALWKASYLKSIFDNLP